MDKYKQIKLKLAHWLLLISIAIGGLALIILIWVIWIMSAINWNKSSSNGELRYEQFDRKNL